MKKPFYIIAGIALTGCIYFESSPTYSSEAVRDAELRVEQQFTNDYKDSPDHYEMHIISDNLILTDPNTGTEIYRESLNSNSILAEAILKDNE